MRLAERFSALIVRLRWFVVLLWGAAAIFAATSLPSIGGSSGGLGQLVVTDADAIQAEIRSAELFEFPLLSRTILVQRDPSGLSPEAQARAVERVARLNAGRLPEEFDRIAFALPVSNTLGGPPFSRESSTTALTFLFFLPEVGRDERIALADEFASRYISRPSDAYVGVTGAVSARAEEVERIDDGLPLVELGTFLVVTLAIALHFRAPGASLVNLLAVAITYVVASGGVAAIGDEIGIEVPAEVQPVLVALLFGIVTDYSIFYLSRLRGRLRAGQDPRSAALETSADTVPIVLAAGVTVAAASVTLIVAQLGFYRAFGPGLALSALIAVAIAVTFMPAVMAIAGRWLFWPSAHRVPSGESASAEAEEERAETGAEGAGGRSRLRTGRDRVLSLPVRRPWPTAAVTLLILGVAALGLIRLDLGNTQIKGLPYDSESRMAFRVASEGFAPGILSPTELIVEGEGITQRRAALARLQRAIESRPGVAEVIGPGQVAAPVDLGAVYSQTGDAARYFIVLNYDPLSGRGINIFNRIQDSTPALLRNAGLADAGASFAGDTALSSQTVGTTEEDLGRILPAAILAVLIVLCLFLRAIVASIYLVLSSALALAATLGLASFVFEDLLGRGQLAFYVPFAVTVLLLALGSDYNVYLAGRVWDEARRRPWREAVAVASRQASGAITTAGVVLAASFALLALVPLAAFQELGFTVAGGLLIDAFLVRTMLAPALMTIVGERSLWPRRDIRKDRGDATTSGS